VHTIKDESVSRDDDVKIEMSSAQTYEKDASKTKKEKQASSNCSLIESPKWHKLNDDAPDLTLITSTLRAMIENVQPTTTNILATKDVSETRDNSFATVVQDRVQTVEGQEALRDHLGPLGQKYIEAVLRDERIICTTFISTRME